MTILVSACLLGIPCRYDGAGAPVPALLRAVSRHRMVPVCPEQLGGLPTPRVPAERRGNRIVNADGMDVSAAYRRGAEVCCAIARQFACSHAILKSKSPSCGLGSIYDGSFTGILTAGNGIAAQRLLEQGLHLADEHTFSKWNL